MSGLTFFKCYPQDFLNGVMGLGPNEGWIYTLIIMQQYDRGEGIPINVRALAARAMMRPSSVEAALRKLVELGKIVIEGGRWSNPRAEKDTTYARHLQQIAIENGQKGGRKSGKKPNEINADLNPTLTQPLRQPEARSQKPEVVAGEPAREAAKDPGKEFEAAILEACPTLSGAYASAPGLWDLSPVYRWLSAGYDLHGDIIPTVRAYLDRPKARTPRSWAFFEGMLAEFREKRLAVPKAAEAPAVFEHPRFLADGALRPDADGVVRVVQGRRREQPRFEPDAPEMADYWRNEVIYFLQTREWREDDIGPKPGRPHSLVPDHLLREFSLGVYNPAHRPEGSARTPNPAHH